MVDRASTSPDPSSRRADYTAQTRAALLDEAAALIAERGYASTSLEEVTQRARVTKGALYHHFPGGKKALLAAAVEREEQVVLTDVGTAVAAAPSRWDAALAALEVFLDACTRPTYRTLVLSEAPVVLGPQRQRHAQEAGGTLAALRSLLEGLVAAGEIDEQPLGVLTTLLWGLLAAAAAHVAEADDAVRARGEAGDAVRRLIEGLRRR